MTSNGPTLALDPDLDMVFFNAAKTNDLDQMMAIRHSGHILSTKTVLTSLAIAAWEGHFDIVEYVLNLLSYYYINSNQGDGDGYGSALYAASKAGHLNIVRTLLTHANRINLSYIELGYAFGFAFRAEKNNVLTYFLENHLYQILQFFPVQCQNSSLDIAEYCFKEYQSKFSSETLRKALQVLDEKLEKNSKLRQEIELLLKSHELENHSDFYSNFDSEEDNADHMEIVFVPTPMDAFSVVPSASSLSEFTPEENITYDFYEAAKNGQLDILTALLTQDKAVLRYFEIGKAFHHAFLRERTNVMDYLLNNYLFEVNQYFIENIKELSNSEMAYAFHYTLKVGILEGSVRFLENDAQLLSTTALQEAVAILNSKIEGYTISGNLKDKNEHQGILKGIEVILSGRESAEAKPSLYPRVQKDNSGARSIPFTPQYESQNTTMSLLGILKANQSQNDLRQQEKLEGQKRRERDRVEQRNTYIKMLKADGIPSEHIDGILVIWDEENPSPFKLRNS